MILKGNMRFGCLLALLFASLFSYAQGGSLDAEHFRPDPEREKMFLPYMATRHGGMEGLAQWKKSNIVLYYKELWYYTESFYIKRNYLEQGATMDEAMIDITRFEQERKQDTEAIVTLGGYRDVLVLLPASRLKYNPGYRNQ